MDVYREMEVQAGGNAQLDAFLGVVAGNLPPKWTRDWALEDDLEEDRWGRLPWPMRYFCFTYDGDDRLPQATICLIEDQPGRLRFSSVVPRKKYQLAIGESNALLEEFYRSVLEPSGRNLGVQVVLSSKDKDLSEWLSEAAVNRFREFSDGANKRAGYLLPIDRDRWLDFVLTAHRDNSRLDASTLRRWLIEIEGWSPEIAERLAGEYAFGGELLTFSENH